MSGIKTDSNDLGTLNGPGVGGSRTQQMLDALKNGATLSAGENAPSVGLDSVNEEVQEEPLINESESVEEVEDSSVQPEEASLSSDSEDVSLGNSTGKSPAKDLKVDIAEIKITDDKGQRKVKVDFSDKDKLTKYVQLAYGARKWQKERDEVKKQLDEKVQMWDKFEAAWKQGYKGLINTLEGSEGAFDKLVTAEIERRQALEDMSPVERRNMEIEEKIRQQELATEKKAKDLDKKLEEIKAKESEAETKELQSKLNPSFERYRFAGKLGNEVAEHEFDSMLWERTLARLEKLPDSVNITQAMIDKEFRTVASLMSGHLKGQADKEVKKSIETKKTVAANKVQAAAKRGVTPKTGIDEVRESLRAGNMTDALTKFFKSGGKMK
jgi:hypothetical protein